MSASPRFAILLLGLALTPGSTPAQEGKHLLRYAFTKGKTGSLRMVQHADLGMNMAGRSIDTTMNMQTYLSYEVASVTEGKALLRVTIDRVIAKMANPMMGDIDFDSADEGARAGPLESMLDMVGETMEVSVDPRGKTSAVKLPEAVKKAAAGGSGVNMEELFSQMTAALPEEPVAIGEAWDTKFDHQMGGGGKLDAVAHNTLVSVDGNKIEISQTMELKLDAGDSPMPMKAKTNAARGSFVIDLGEGIPQKMDMSIDMQMSSDGGPMEMTMDMKMDVTLDRQAPPPAPTKGDKGGAKGKDGGV